MANTNQATYSTVYVNELHLHYENCALGYGLETFFTHSVVQENFKR